jgi:hypothetical protein
MGKVMEYNIKGCILVDLLIEVLHSQFDFASRERSLLVRRLPASSMNYGDKNKDIPLGR